MNESHQSQFPNILFSPQLYLAERSKRTSSSILYQLEIDARLQCVVCIWFVKLNRTV